MVLCKSMEFHMSVFAGVFNSWVLANTLGLLPNLSNKQEVSSEKLVPTPLSLSDEFRGRKFTVTFLEKSLDYSWLSREGKRMYDSPVYNFLQTLEQKTGIIMHKKPATSYAVLMNALRGGKADFAVAFAYFTPERLKILDATAPVAIGALCLVMKRAPYFTFGMVLLSPYESSTWAALLLSLCAFTMIWYVVHVFSLVQGRYIKTSSDSSVSHAVLDVIQIVLSSSCTRLVQTNAQRVSLAAVLSFAVVVSNAYSGQLLGLLAHPPRHKDPQNLEEAARIIETVYLTEDLKAVVISANEDGMLTELINKIKPRNFGFDLGVLQRMATVGKESILFSWRDFNFFAYYKELVDKGDRSLHSVPDCFFTPGHQSFLIRKNSTFYEVFNKVALLATESGLFDQWTRSQRHHMDANGITVPVKFHIGQAQPLTLEQLSGPFTLLGIAWGIASVIMIVELLLSRINRNVLVDSHA